jgi:hypothetical protein
MANHPHRELKRKSKELEREGFSVWWTADGHLKVCDPETSKRITLVSSKSDWRSARNNEAALKRLRRCREEFQAA